MPSEAIYVKAKSGAALGDFSVRKFHYLVAEGRLPKPVDLAGMKRWDRTALVDALRGLAEPAGGESAS